MTNVLVLTPDVLKQRMAGPAIRAWEIATELSRKHHDVRLVSVTGVPVERESELFSVASIWRDRPLKQQVKWADVVIVQGTLTTEFSWILRTSAKLVVDLYDPMHLEILEQAIDFPIRDRARMVASTSASLDVQIRRADFMLCASAKQKDFWLGQLMANGRINPYTYDVNGNLSNLIEIVPFGLAETPPQRTAPAIKGVVEGIDEDDEVIIWGGGIYNWFDPVTLVRAMVNVEAARPHARLFFMGSGHPNPAVPQMAVARKANALADELGLLNRVVFFNEGWVPYEDRANFLLDADLGVSTHSIHLETEFSFRTRILDYLWAGLPMVATEGDGFADLIARRDLGVVVPEHDADVLAEAIISLLSNQDAYGLTQERITAIAREFEWPSVLAPLVAFCDAPQFAPDRAVREHFWRTSPVAKQVVTSLRHGMARGPLRFARVNRLRLKKLFRGKP
ncbi:MAG: glycosyltransferase family 4 protein [Microbacteriaceae bacterium]